MPKRMTPERAAENAAKRAKFNPTEYWDEEYPWFLIDVGQEFVISSFMHSTTVVHSMAQYRTKLSGRIYSVKSIPRGSRVTRTA